MKSTSRIAAYRPATRADISRLADKIDQLPPPEPMSTAPLEQHVDRLHADSWAAAQLRHEHVLKRLDELIDGLRDIGESRHHYLVARLDELHKEMWDRLTQVSSELGQQLTALTSIVVDANNDTWGSNRALHTVVMERLAAIEAVAGRIAPSDTEPVDLSDEAPAPHDSVASD
jgi:hypothetical protein